MNKSGQTCGTLSLHKDEPMRRDLLVDPLPRQNPSGHGGRRSSGSGMPLASDGIYFIVIVLLFLIDLFL